MSYREDSKREQATVGSVFYGTEDHGILTCSLMMEGKGWGQAFGNICLDKKTGPDFVAELCKLFGVSKLEELKGRQCYVLRSFGYNNDPIEGLEVDGHRFTLTAWRRRHYPKTKSRLAEEQQQVDKSIAANIRGIHEARERRERLPDDYTEWTP